MEPISIVALAGIAGTVWNYAAYVRQTARANRAEAALARVNATVSECESALVAHRRSPIDPAAVKAIVARARENARHRDEGK